MIRLIWLGLGGAVVAIAGCNSLPNFGVTTSPSPLPTPLSSVSPSPASPTPTVSPKSAATQKLEAKLQTDIAKRAGVAVQSVNCPTTVQVEAGKLFECQAIAEGKSFTVVINPQPEKPVPNSQTANSQTANSKLPSPNRKLDNSELQWNTKGLLVLPKLEQTIQKGIKDQFRIQVKTNCGGKVRVARPGDTFQCKVTDQRGQTKPVTVRVDDEKGNVTWKL